jgi:hypothetical protein
LSKSELDYITRDTNSGNIVIKWKDWVAYKDDNGDESLSIEDIVRDTDERTFPISFNPNPTDDESTNNNGGIVAVELVGDATTATITPILRTTESGSPTTTDNIEGGEEGGENESSIEGESISLNNTYGKIKYIELPKNITGLKLNFEASSNEITADEAKEVSDTLIIGYPKFYKNSTKYSNQVKVTSEKIANALNGNGIITNDDAVTTNLKNNIKEYPEFNLTHQVSETDKINSNVGNSNNWDNLFAGEVVWDKNHICNKYAIPQYDFKNSKIEVASSMIKK